MSKVLIVDDDEIRSAVVKQKLEDKIGSELEVIDVVDCIQRARVLMKQKHYTAVFLDMALPLYSNDKKIDEKAGVKLLGQVLRNRFKTPNRIIGYTALEKNVEAMEEEFSDVGFKLFVSKAGDYSWVDKAIKQVLYTLAAIGSTDVAEKDMALVTIHGILTFGDWQQSLYEKVKVNNSADKIEHLSFKYARLDFFTFAVPGLRNWIVNRFRADLVNWLENNYCKKIVCFSHSFGTFVLLKALETIEDENLVKNIELIVLSGSVLKQNHSFDNLLKKLPRARIVNDCAVNDKALIASKGIVLGMGMAGKLGFCKLENSNFINRNFKGGHSSFFKEPEFMDNYWLPLLTETDLCSQKIVSSDYGILDKCLDNVAKLSSFLKVGYYAILFYAVSIPFIFLFKFIKSFL